MTPRSALYELIQDMLHNLGFFLHIYTQNALYFVMLPFVVHIVCMFCIKGTLNCPPLVLKSESFVCPFKWRADASHVDVI